MISRRAARCQRSLLPFQLPRHPPLFCLSIQSDPARSPESSQFRGGCHSCTARASGVPACTTQSRLTTRKPAARTWSYAKRSISPRIPTAVRRIRIGEQLSDVSEGRRAEHRIGDRVQQHVCVAVSVQASVERDVATADPQGATIHEAVGIKANPNSIAGRGSQPSLIGPGRQHASRHAPQGNSRHRHGTAVGRAAEKCLPPLTLPLSPAVPLRGPGRGLD